MTVQCITLSGNRRRYLLINDSGEAIVAVAKYIRFLDNTGKRSNTIKTYCYSLKAFFEFLKLSDLSYEDVSVENLVDFVGWLRHPVKDDRIIYLKPVDFRRRESTCNMILSVVYGFYDYLYRTDQISSALIATLMVEVPGRRKKYKNFLYHVTQNRPSIEKYLKIKEPKRKIAVLKKEEVLAIYQATTNIRDRFLIRLLYETGLRIGEALSLYIEDFQYNQAGHRIHVTDRGEIENGAYVKSGERMIDISQELFNLFDDYLYDVIDELNTDTSFVFVKLKGRNKGMPMEYQDVGALFSTLKKKTGISATPHLLRHTHATTLYSETKDIKLVQERLGHAQIQTTMNLYIHMSSDEIRSSWELAQNNFTFEEENDGGSSALE